MNITKDDSFQVHKLKVFADSKKDYVVNEFFSN